MGRPYLGTLRLIDHCGSVPSVMCLILVCTVRLLAFVKDSKHYIQLKEACETFLTFLTYFDLFWPILTYSDTKLSMFCFEPYPTEEGPKAP